MAKLESDIQLRVLDYEKQMIQAKSSVITTEASGQSWLQQLATHYHVNVFISCGL